MEYKDYYAVLGIEKTATDDEIKQAYRKLARKYHPDLNKDAKAEGKFKDIGEANDVLSDPEKRTAYDQLGQGYQPGQDFQPPPSWSYGNASGNGPAGTGDHGQSHDFSDFFKDLFGQTGRQQHQQQQGTRPQPDFNIKGQDHHARVVINIQDSFKGVKRTLTLKAPQRGADGHVILKNRTLDVTIPKGVHEGQHIRLKQQGAPGHGKGQPGDLYLEVSFKPHKYYHAEKNDLYLDLPITPWEAALGGKIKTPTPDGVVDLNIPAGSKQGRKLRLKGRGIPAKQPGDLFIVLNIVLPPADSEKAKELYTTMAKELDFNPRADLATELAQKL